MATPTSFGRLSIAERFRLIQCAKLAEFAYDLADPEPRIGEVLRDFQSPQVIKFFRFHSRSWFTSKAENQWMPFRSHAYVCHFRHGSCTKNNQCQDVTPKNKIVVAFRGTWNNLNGTTGVRPDPSGSLPVRAIQWTIIKLYNLFQKLPRADNIGWSDFYYNSFVIRLPYTEGKVYKWYSYWGAVMLEMTRRLWHFSPPRIVASWLISRPNNKLLKDRDYGDVHLGFWSLWASPEGFSGDYHDHITSEGTRKERGVLEEVMDLLQDIKEEETEVWIVGHSLGGAVSCFATLDIARALENQVSNLKNKKITLHHVTVGAPPIGTEKFATYFNRELGKRGHSSWAIAHDRDLIPVCFDWCRSTRPLTLLKWWNDWATVGTKVSIQLLNEVPSIMAEQSYLGLVKKKLQPVLGTILTGLSRAIFVIAFSPILLSMCVSNVFCFLGSTIWYYCSGDKFAKIQNPEEPWHNPRSSAVHELKDGVGLEYHSLKTYIKLMEMSTPKFIENTPVEGDTPGSV